MQGGCEHKNIPNYGVTNKKIFVMRKANSSSIEVSETNKPTLNPPSEEKAVRQSDASLLQNSKSEEKVVREEIYTLPDLTKTNEKKNSIDNVNETDGESVSLNNQGSLSESYSNKEAQVDIEKVSINKSSELTEQNVNISSASGNLCLKTRVSSDPIDDELSSDSSKEFLDDDDLKIKKKKKKEDLLKSENIENEDAEEKFRRNFLKTFQDLPRLSQISLDDDPKNTKNKQNAKPVKSASNSDIEIISTISSNETVVSIQPVTPLIEEVENNLKNTEMDKLPSSKQHKSPHGSQDVLDTDKIIGSPSSSTNKDI